VRAFVCQSCGLKLYRSDPKPCPFCLAPLAALPAATRPEEPLQDEASATPGDTQAGVRI
jgi:hypothetical protein